MVGGGHTIRFSGSAKLTVSLHLPGLQVFALQAAIGRFTLTHCYVVGTISGGHCGGSTGERSSFTIDCETFRVTCDAVSTTITTSGCRFSFVYSNLDAA